MLRAASAAVAAALTAGVVHAQSSAPASPSKPLRLVVGFPPGSGADITARVIAGRLTQPLGHQVIVDNRPGASSNIAAELVAKAQPDGHTLFIGTVANAINATLYAKLPFDFQRDFAAVTLATAAPNVLVVHPSLPVQSVRELIALATSRPGQLNFASSGTGTAPHLSAELFNSMAGVRMTHVPYKGSPPAVADLMAGEVAVMFSPVSTVLPHVKSGRLRALAVTTSTRLPSLPSLPTVSEAALKGYETITWFGIVAPAKTPAPAVSRLNAEIVKILGLPEVRQQFAVQGIETLGGTPEQFAAYIREEVAKWAKVIKAAGVRAD
ncbi:MAG TPA: tripartite tricarboxylate transporter substrate binding protein [Burkholderiales bacterium]|nr:tripartite tricarboxylate transporter substrate binding protein [Burkholderiales bacterium]